MTSFLVVLDDVLSGNLRWYHLSHPIFQRLAHMAALPAVLYALETSKEAGNCRLPGRKLLLSSCTRRRPGVFGPLLLQKDRLEARCTLSCKNA